MKFLRLTCVLAFALFGADLEAQVKIGANPETKDLSSILELESVTMGLLIPRVSLADVFDNSTVPSPANSLLVYNTNFGGGPDAVMPGFYYWRSDQARWVRLVSTIEGPYGDVWIDGNNNILSANSANQSLGGEYCVILGERAFADDENTSFNVIAIGTGAAEHDTTSGDARNIFIGYQAGYNNGGYNVTFMGRESGMNNDGDNVVGIGDYAGYSNTGNNVNGFGERAAQGNTGNNVNALGPFSSFLNSGSQVNAFGLYSGFSNDGHYVNVMGESAAWDNTGNNLNAMGQFTARNNNGENVNAMGMYAAYGNTVDAYSVNAFGVYAAGSNSGPNLNAFGSSAAQYNSGEHVNAIGQSAAANNTGDTVSAMGYEAARYNDGNNVVAIGVQALLGSDGVLEGSGNIGIGDHAGMNIGTGSNNISIGFNTLIDDGNSDDQINIGNNIIRDANGVIQLKDLIQLTPTSAPASPVAGMIYFDSGDNTLYCYDGTSWHALWEP